MDKTPEEQPREEQIPEESKSARIVKRILIISVSLILIFLILSYLVPNHDFFWIVAGRMESYKIEDNTITLKNGAKIIFQNDSYGDLTKIYYENQQHEFKACLMGSKENSNYYVEKIEVPKIFSQGFSSVMAEPCTKEAIISLHSHPYKSCFLSLHDARGYKFVKDVNKDAIIGIMCESNRFNFYGHEK